MSEVEFRGKRVDNGKWVYGSLVHKDLIRNHATGLLLKTVNMGAEGKLTCDVFRVDPVTVGQFTGLPDKKGIKIYGGDIARHVYHGVFKVIYINGAFYCSPIGYKPTPRYLHECYEWLEVIGNIYDNYELLKLMESEMP